MVSGISEQTGANLDHGSPDQFVIQVIEAPQDFIRVRIDRNFSAPKEFVV